ncbi:MAG: rod shape-determining protein MreC, partial [Amphiplicatus sp.]
LDDQGLVGRIVDVGVRASRILLLTDVQSRVPVYVEDANLEGILVGRTKANPSISFTASTDPVVFTPGQRVLTSGAGGSLPRGLAIGVIVGDEKGDAVVDLYADYARTRMVRVVNYDFPAFEEAPEQGPDEASIEAAGAADPPQVAPAPVASAGGDPLANPDARAAAAAAPGEPEGVD